MRTDVKEFLKKVALGGALVAATVGAQAATQGTTGTTSTGTVEIDLQIDDAVRISNLDDIDLGTFTGTGPLTGSDTACVYSNGATGYNVTATTVTGAFELSDGTNTIPFTLRYDDDATPADGGLLGYGSSTFMANAASVDDNCSGGDNASFEVEVTAVDASSVPQGAYDATLTLLVAPI